jgi:hypothetical protein
MGPWALQYSTQSYGANTGAGLVRVAEQDDRSNSTPVRWVLLVGGVIRRHLELMQEFLQYFAD